MSKQLTAGDFQESLNGHVSTKGAEIREKYGPHIGWKELLLILEDRAAVRYPCEIVFSDEELQSGEVAHPLGNGPRPEDGFKMYVHPYFSTQLGEVPYLVLYQLVSVNYGEFASADDAETFASAALGLTKDEYYRKLCALADQLEAN